MEKETEMVTVRQAAEMLGVSRATIARMMRRGDLQAFRNPVDRRLRLIRREDIERLRETFIPVDRRQPERTSQ